MILVMKNRLFSHCMASVCGVMMLVGAASCEKMVINHEGLDEGTCVMLRIGNFEQTPFPARTRGSVGDVCTRLNFLVYNSQGERIRQVEQSKEDEDFGEADIHLPEGRYFLVVLAHSSDGNPTSTNARRIGFTNKTGFTDTFLYADSLTVGDEEVDKTLTLKRIVAMVRFVFEDEIPAKAGRVRFYYTGGSGTLDAGNNGWGAVKSKQAQFYNLSHNEKKFEIYTIPHNDDDLLDVTVTTYESENDNIVTEREVTGIPVKRNHITTCRGYLFYPLYGMKFDISIDDSWDDDENIEFEF